MGSDFNSIEPFFEPGLENCIGEFPIEHEVFLCKLIQKTTVAYLPAVAHLLDPTIAVVPLVLRKKRHQLKGRAVQNKLGWVPRSLAKVACAASLNARGVIAQRRAVRQEHCDIKK